MYAVIELGGRQWKVEPGTRFDVNRLEQAVGANVSADRVLMAHDGSQLRLGQPYVAGMAVTCEVLEHRLGPKEISYHFRRRENWRKTVGHRQQLTRLLVKAIQLPGVGAAEPAQSVSVQRVPRKAAATHTVKKGTVTPKAKVRPSTPPPSGGVARDSALRAP